MDHLEIGQIISQKLTEFASSVDGRELEVLDIGVFPWFGYIELSMRFAGDKEDFDDIADWPYYSCVDLSAELDELSAEMKQGWTGPDVLSSKDFHFSLISQAAGTQSVKTALANYDLSADFTLQILNDDEPLHRANRA